jgi:hypothetical protein
MYGDEEAACEASNDASLAAQLNPRGAVGSIADSYLAKQQYAALNSYQLAQQRNTPADLLIREAHLERQRATACRIQSEQLQQEAKRAEVRASELEAAAQQLSRQG